MSIKFVAAEKIYMDLGLVNERLASLRTIKIELHNTYAKASKLNFATEAGESTGPVCEQVAGYNKELAKTIKEIKMLVGKTIDYIDQQKKHLEESQK